VPLEIMIILLYFLLSAVLTLVDVNRARGRYALLRLSCLALAVMAGFRSLRWNDTKNYWDAFSRHTRLLWDFSLSDTPYQYSEKGFLLLSSAIKTVCDSPRFYLVAVSLLTMFALCRVLRKYSVYPLVGLMIYVSRFFVPRHFMQIRAALAILIAVYAISYIQRRDWRRYFAFVLAATALHASAALAVPLYWLYRIRLTPRVIVCSLLVGLCVAYAFPDSVVSHVTRLSYSYDIAAAYTAEDGEFTAGKGLRNPVIYYQTAILLAFTRLVFRRGIAEAGCNRVLLWGYFYSTMILIVFSPFSILSGRTSTLFATLEVCIVPRLICHAGRETRLALCLAALCCYTALMYIGSLSWP